MYSRYGIITKWLLIFHAISMISSVHCFGDDYDYDEYGYRHDEDPGDDEEEPDPENDEGYEYPDNYEDEENYYSDYYEDERDVKEDLDTDNSEFEGESPDCEPLKPGDVIPSDCCRAEIFRESFLHTFYDCSVKFPDRHKDSSCLFECMFGAIGLLDSGIYGFTLNRDRVKRAFGRKMAEMAPGDDDIEGMVDYWFTDARYRIPTNARCRSGSAQFILGLMREAYMKCPPELKNKYRKDQCQDLLEKIDSCPDMPVLL